MFVAALMLGLFLKVFDMVSFPVKIAHIYSNCMEAKSCYHDIGIAVAEVVRVLAGFYYIVS